MTRIREAILVEGRYDVNTVRQVVDTVVLESGGFRIFNNKDQLKLLRRIAETRGLIVLTDSDGAGFVIRNRIKVYREQTEVVGAYYARQNKYFEVDGVGSMDEVFDRICRVVDAHR